MRIWASVLLGALLSACAAPTRFPDAPPAFLFQDKTFAPPKDRIRASDVFAVNDSMRNFLHVELPHRVHWTSPANALLEALHTEGLLRLEYDASMTRNAAEAFEARRGNCLSLVIMTAAFAKELGLEVDFHAARIAEVWSRNGDLLLGSGHVNVSLSSWHNNIGARAVYLDSLTVDFLAGDEVAGLATREITEATVVAMYMNNKAVESLVRGDLDDAYGWIRESVRQDPQFASAYNTLGVVYERHGDLLEAERVLEYVLEKQPNNVTVLSNLADVQERLGNPSEAGALRSRLARLDPHPPYYFFNLGMAAMHSGDFRTAKAMFAREVTRADYNPEFHFWLAQAYMKLDDPERARRHLALAVEKSSDRSARDLYTAKLAWLMSNQHSHASPQEHDRSAPERAPQ